MDDLNFIIANLQDAIEKTDKSLQSLKNDQKIIESKYEPVTDARRNFKNWRDSDEGKKTKIELYENQRHICANPDCGLKNELPIEYFEIDHKLPITKFPELALDKSNMQLLCTPCNRKKNSKI